MRGYTLEYIANVDTDQGRRGYSSKSGYRPGTGYRSELYIFLRINMFLMYFMMS